MGFDFTLIAPLLPSHCGFSSVLGHGVSSLVKSRVFLSMIVQQPVVILELSQEGVSARPSTPPSWLISAAIFFGSVSILEAGRPKIKVLTDSAPGDNPLTGLQAAAFLLCLYMVNIPFTFIPAFLSLKMLADVQLQTGC